MKYYKVETITQYNYGERVLPRVNGKNVPNGKYYFNQMEKVVGNSWVREIIDDAPIFDYFHLETLGTSNVWEWKLQDIHGFTGTSPGGGNWFISKKYKEILEIYKIAPRYKFYLSKLKYRSEKLDYYVLQFADIIFQNINFAKSFFYIENQQYEQIDHIFKANEYLDWSNELYRSSKKKVIWERYAINDAYDLVPMYGLRSDVLISDRLRTAIEEAKIDGVRFEEVKYEVIVG